MKWESGRRSSNLADRRGQSAFNAGGLLGALPLLMSAGRRGGLGAVALILIVLWVLNGGLSNVLSPGRDATGTVVEGVPGEESTDFLSVVLASTEDQWSAIFRDRGAAYRPPQLVVFDNQVSSACGFQSAATGPFYCPLDQTIYLDLGFFRQLAGLGGAGDFAAAYVVGHEVGHHVQSLLGTSDRVRRAAGAGNALSVKLELQADCYAGVWANRTHREGVVTLSPGDVDEGLEAARAIGDDRLQSRQGGSVHPESFTHGTSAQRAGWLRAGLESGSLDACDTFAD
jgi:predicted metalloprotease